MHLRRRERRRDEKGGRGRNRVGSAARRGEFGRRRRRRRRGQRVRGDGNDYGAVEIDNLGPCHRGFARLVFGDLQVMCGGERLIIVCLKNKVMNSLFFSPILLQRHLRQIGGVVRSPFGFK